MGIVIFIISAIIMALVAVCKGFNPLLWLLAGGIPGFIILCCLPSAKSADINGDVRAARARMGNTVGGVISGIAVVLVAVLFAVVANM